MSSGLNTAESRISSFVSKVNKIGELGDVFQNLGTKLTAGLTVPIIGLGSASIKSFGEIHGNFEATTQYYIDDTIIGAPPVPEKVLMNGFLNLFYLA